MRTHLFNIIVASLLGAILLQSCNDEEFIYNKEIKSEQLITALKSKGFNFEGNMLIVDDKARAVKSLDLTGLNLSNVDALARLEVLPNLEELLLANNNFGQSFDFSKLPPNIKSVNLQDNEIYEYKGLVNVNFETAAIKTLRKFEKLVFPYSARFNVEALPFYFESNADADMQMQNKNGEITPYTTLREIPDLTLRKYLKRVFSSKFEGDKLDIKKSFSLEDRTAKMNISTVGGFWGDPELANKSYTSIEGIEYILNDSRFEGDFWALLNSGEEYTTGYIKLGKKCEGFNMSGISTPILDLSEAESIYKCSTSNNKLVKKIDLSASKKMMQRGEKGSQAWFVGDAIGLSFCPKLEELILPDLSNTSELKTTCIFSLIALPELRSSIDISKLQVCVFMVLGGIYQVPEIKYPEKIAYFTSNGEKPEREEEGKMSLIVDKDIYNRNSTRVFIEKYRDSLEDEVKDSEVSYFTNAEEIKKYNYKTEE